MNASSSAMARLISTISAEELPGARVHGRGDARRQNASQEQPELLS